MRDCWSISPPYPTHCLPPTLSDFVCRVATITQAPEALVGPVVLAAASAAVQGVADVLTPYRSLSPTSLYAWVIAPTGSRKSSVLNHVTAEFRKFEPSDEGSQSTENEKLSTPRRHQFLLEDATEAGVIDLYRKGAKSLFYALDEGAVLFSKLNVAAFCKKWNGDAIRQVSRTEGNILLRNRRAAVCLLTQGVAFDRLMKKRGEEILLSGLLPRCLLSFIPELPSPPASRVASSGEEDALRDHAFHSRVGALLKCYSDSLEQQDARREVIDLSPQAVKAWQAFQQQVGDAAADNGHLADVRPFIDRAGEQVIRLAAVLQHFENPVSSISCQAVEAASSLVRWHIGEVKEAFGEPPAWIQVQRDAQRLFQYMMSRYQRTGRAIFTRSDLQRCAPEEVRSADRLDSALHQLQLTQQACVTFKQRREIVCLNVYALPAQPCFLSSF